MPCETCDSCPTFNPKDDLKAQFDKQQDRIRRSLLYYKMNSCDNLLYKLLYQMHCTDNELIDTVKELQTSGGGGGGGGTPPDYQAVKQRVTNLETTVSGYGTAATKDFGISAGSVPVIGTNGKLDPTILPPSTGSSIETSTYTAVAQGGNDFIISYGNKTISAPKANTSLYYIRECTSIQLLSAVSDFSLSGQMSVNADGTAMGTVSNSKLTFLSGQTQARAVSIAVIGDHCYINVLSDKPSVIKDVPRTTVPVHTGSIPPDDLTGTITFEVKNDKLWLDLTKVELTAAYPKNRIGAIWVGTELHEALSHLYTANILYIPVVVRGTTSSGLFTSATVSIEVSTISDNVFMTITAMDDISATTGTNTTIEYSGVTQLTL